MRTYPCRRSVKQLDNLGNVLERIKNKELSIDLFHQVCCLFLEEENRGALESIEKKFFLDLQEFHEDKCLGELVPDFRFRKGDTLTKNNGNCVIKITALLESADDYQYIVVDEEGKGKLTMGRENLEKKFSKVANEQESA